MAACPARRPRPGVFQHGGAGAYQAAYDEVLSNTSTEWAPWHVIPADHKWFERLAAGAVILHEIMLIDPQYPEVGPQHRQ